MTSGYDQRSRQGDPLPYRFYDRAGVLMSSGVSPQKSSTVTSYRSNVTGTRLTERQVDLYGGFLQRNNSMLDYFRPGPRLLAQLETSGLADKSDYMSIYGDGVDNGHPFEASSQTISTSVRQPVSFRPDGQAAGVRCTGMPVVVNQMTVSPSGLSKMPFKFSGLSSTEAYFSYTTPIPAPPTTQLRSDGTQLLTSLYPDSPKVSITAALLELALGLPAIPGSALRNLSFGNVGDEYLNAVFGIMPTWDDAVEIAHTLRDISMKIHQIRRDSGRHVRRKGKLPVSIRSEILTGSDISEYRMNAGIPISGTRWNTTDSYSSSLQTVYRNPSLYPTENQLFMSEQRFVTFSGSYTYILPEIPGFSGRLEKYLASMDALLGLSFSARIAWQIQPWSWLIDWFLDIRQNLAAISEGHDDNHVVNYAYVMETVERRAVAKVTFTGPTPIDGIKFVSTARNASFKRRLRANPYGFVSESDSSAWGPYRLAILAALGISRAA